MICCFERRWLNTNSVYSAPFLKAWYITHFGDCSVYYAGGDCVVYLPVGACVDNYVLLAFDYFMGISIECIAIIINFRALLMNLEGSFLNATASSVPRETLWTALIIFCALERWYALSISVHCYIQFAAQHWGYVNALEESVGELCIDLEMPVLSVTYGMRCELNGEAPWIFWSILIYCDFFWSKT